MKKYILNNHIRYREENEYILLCDCMRLLDYEMPIDTLPLLDSLKKGVSKEELSKVNRSIMKEMYDLGLVVDSHSKQERSIEDPLGRLSYEESRFL